MDNPTLKGVLLWGVIPIGGYGMHLFLEVYQIIFGTLYLLQASDIRSGQPEMVEFSLATAANFIDEDDELDEEPGEVVESAPPLKEGEEREIRCSDGTSLKKKLLKLGHGLETPEFGDEVTVHYVGFLLDGTKFVSTRGEDQPFTFKLGKVVG